MNRVVIFGADSFAETVHFYLTHDSDNAVSAFTIHEDRIIEKQFKGLPIIPFEKLTQDYPPEDFHMFVAVGASGMNRVRARIYHEAKNKGYRLINYISSKCTHWGDTKIGDNCFILEDNTIQPFVSIGSNVVLWSGNHIGHRATIGDHTFITSHVVVSGHARIGSYCYIGVNATIRDSISIGDSCLIGAGSIIMKATKEREVYIPARTNLDPRSSSEINF